MATLGVIDFMKLWTQSGQEAERKMVKHLEAGLDRVIQTEDDTLRRLTVGGAISNPVVRWMEEWGYPTKITGSLSTATFTVEDSTQKLFGQAVNAERIKGALRVGTILQRKSDGMQVRVSSISGIADPSPYTCTVAAHGFSSLSDDAGPVDYDILAELWYDYRDAEQPRALDRLFWDVGTQTHAETFEIPKMRKNTKYELVADEVEHQIDALLYKLRLQLAKAVLRIEPTTSDGSTVVWSDGSQESSMCGILPWITRTQARVANLNVYRNKAGVELYKSDLDALIKAMWLEQNANLNTGKWAIVMDPTTHSYCQDFDMIYRRTTKDEKSVGFKVNTFEAKIGKSFDVIADRNMRDGTLAVVNFAEAKYGYYNQDKLDRKELKTAGRYQQWLISFVTYGVVLRNPHCNLGVIYGLPTS